MAIHTVIDNAIATITIDRPEALNALDVPSQAELRAQLLAVRDDDAVRVIVLTGAGTRAFCAGADLKNTPASTDPYASAWTSGDEVATRRGAYVRMLNLERLSIWKPMIAAVNGHCLGGGMELALQCDLRVASDSASFALPEVRVGSVAGVCGPLLMRVIPQAHAMKMLMTGARIDAAEALRIGLVSDVWSAADLPARVQELARTIASNAPLSVAATKRAARETEVLPRAALADMTEMVFGMLKDTEDRSEGRRAFAEKRIPRFTGR
ncbi:enoyl-CoA hydratase/isomerase family protein [Roseomonas sp. KE2513]|uniref:enoyl-CoA hydratase/isomerase family protein n=1 Tax=Roseomonas sp. KE2513 TaxID=2479202 RepID=UPI0018DF9F34|nr:enoyl-CoA hydratase-related protein [Roseomonas sp. KE2513]MBI0539540.1 enoyl-CoA hydratase/isomerase family protein [Roseomonas sp. KE2513]